MRTEKSHTGSVRTTKRHRITTVLYVNNADIRYISVIGFFINITKSNIEFLQMILE